MIYFIKNPLVGTEYFVSSQAEVDANPHVRCYVGGETEALARLIELNQQWMVNEAFRFSISKEVVEGANTTWSAADLDNDPEVGTYHVFNHSTGGYETINSLVAAKQRVDELKAQFIAETTSNTVDTTYALPIINIPNPIPTAKL